MKIKVEALTVSIDGREVTFKPARGGKLLIEVDGSEPKTVEDADEALDHLTLVFMKDIDEADGPDLESLLNEDFELD